MLVPSAFFTEPDAGVGGGGGGGVGVTELDLELDARRGWRWFQGTHHVLSWESVADRDVPAPGTARRWVRDVLRTARGPRALLWHSLCVCVCV